MTYRGHSQRVNSVAWSPDGTRIAAGSLDSTTLAWVAHTGDVLTAYHGRNSAVLAVCWSPDGTRIASDFWDGTVQAERRLASLPIIQRK